MAHLLLGLLMHLNHNLLSTIRGHLLLLLVGGQALGGQLMVRGGGVVYVLWHRRECRDGARCVVLCGSGVMMRLRLCCEIGGRQESACGPRH